MIINITHRNSTLDFCRFYLVLNIPKYFKEKLCNKNLEVISMSCSVTLGDHVVVIMLEIKADIFD